MPNYLRPHAFDPAKNVGKGWVLQTAPLRLIRDPNSPFVYEGDAGGLHLPVNRGDGKWMETPAHLRCLSFPEQVRSIFFYPSVMACPWIGNGRNFWLSRLHMRPGYPDDVDYAVYRQWGWKGVMLRVYNK